MGFRLNEAIALALVNGKPIMKKDMAARLWPNSDETAQQVNMTKLCKGKTERIRPEWVGIICEMTGCSADFLFDIGNE